MDKALSSQNLGRVCWGKKKTNFQSQKFQEQGVQGEKSIWGCFPNPHPEPSPNTALENGFSDRKDSNFKQVTFKQLTDAEKSTVFYINQRSIPEMDIYFDRE